MRNAREARLVACAYQGHGDGYKTKMKEMEQSMLVIKSGVLVGLFGRGVNAVG
ncbi:hypothetical protein [Streptococcus suis]